MKDTRVLTEGAILASLFAIILLITIYVPLIGTITFWALPLPFVVYVVRRGLKPGLALTVIACLLTLVVGGITTVPAALIFGTAGMVVGELFRRKRSGFAVLIGVGLIYTLHMLIVYLCLVLIVGQDPMKMSIDLMKEQMRMTESMFSSFGQAPGQSFEQMMKMIDQLVYLAPFMLVSISVVLALLTVLLSKLLLRRLGHEVNGLPPFREWKFPRSLLWYYLIVLVFAMMGAEEGTMMYVAIFNLFPLLEMILAIQGFAFIFYYCYEKKVATAVPVILVIAGLIIAPLLSVVRILGIIDLGFDLRKRITSQKNRS